MRRAPVELHGPLAEPIRCFVAHKRALNRRFDTEERALRLLDHYLVQQGVTDPATVTPAVIDAFLTSRPRSRPRSYNHLLGVLHRLFDWMVAQEMIDRSPVRLPPRRETARRIPYLFDLPRASRLLETAAALADTNNAPLRGPTYTTIFALLYGLGLRVGEVARLTRADVDLDRRLLVVRETKFAKSRLVPFGPHMAARLVAHLGLREHRFGRFASPAPIFSFSPGRAIHPGTISQTFHALVPHLGLVLPAGVGTPRVHDLRHSFAVGTLLRWYRDGSDPGTQLLHLSTFLGHVDPASTAVYLTITADLLQAAGDRFAHFAYVAGQAPEMLAEAERVAGIPMKRVPSPGTRFLERDEIEALFSSMPTEGPSALRDRALLLFLYNTGSRVQEAADLNAGNLALEPQPRVNLRGKGNKWRTCPLWPETARLLQQLLAGRPDASPASPVFTSRHGAPLTRFGIYKLVRRHTAKLGGSQEGTPRRVSPHVLRHTTAVHLLEAGVEVNVIRGWLGHVSLDTTNRYAEINIRMKEAALAACAPPTSASAGFPRRAVWRDDPSLLEWLTSL